VSLRAGAGNALSLALLVVGAICLLITFAVPLTSGDGDVPLGAVAMSAYQVGFTVATGIALGCMAFTMILHQVNAGWSTLVRRQVENVMIMLFPVCALLFLPLLATVFLKPGMLWSWMNPDYVAGDLIYEHKAAFLNTPFFVVRSVLYFAIWAYLAVNLYRFSKRQDDTADRWLTARARKMSSYGLLLFAFSTAFASFDWLMSLDYHWFSTMFGVYFFAGNFGAALSTVILILLALRKFAGMDDLITREHLHDMGKLLFGFVVFWAYIGFSQYFLIWYANIPEETSWYILRREGGWRYLAIALAAGRFVIPFCVLMPRPFRRSPFVLAFIGIWLISCQIIDIYWVARPTVHDAAGQSVFFHPIDIIGVAGPLLIFVGMIVRRITAGPLVPTNDPRLAESLHHKNYV
jgi:hypothetical protein